MNLEALKNRKNLPYVIIELVMMSLLIVNLNLIIFDWLFQSDTLRSLLNEILPAFHDWYAATVHPDFLLIDLVFVGIFLSEFFLRWMISIYKERYRKWYFYPFIHWYDILGCVPIGTLRFVRLLRVISILSRLHRMGVIDITRNPLFDFIAKYLNILVDEVTDRVVLRILKNIRDEVATGTPVIDQILDDVINPKKDLVVNWLSYRVQKIAAHNAEEYRNDIRNYVDHRIESAVEVNKELKQLQALPFVGPYTAKMIERATADIVFNVINGAIEDLGSPDNREFIEELTNITLNDVLNDEDAAPLNQVVSDLIVQSLDVIMTKVRIQEWKYEDIADDENMLKEKLRANLGHYPGEKAD